MSLIIANNLGYETLDYLDLSTAYIIGNELSSSSGFVEYDIDKNKAVQK